MAQELATLRTELVRRTRSEAERLLEFWATEVVKPDGSFHGVVDSLGHSQPAAPRGLILGMRLLWTFARAARVGLRPGEGDRQIADRLYQFVSKAFWDPQHLGFYWAIDAAGNPIQDHKHLYGQAFAIYALAEYAQLSGSSEALRWAQLTYEVVEDYGSDREYGGYQESFTRTFELDDASRLSTINHGGAAKTMNTHLHMLEAYTRLYQVWPNPTLKQRLGDLLETMRVHIVDQDHYHFHCFLDRQWNPLSHESSFGHDIEGSWLMLEAAQALGDPTREAVFKDLALAMVDRVWDEGMDEDHGLMNEGLEGRIIDDQKHWWPQAEAVVGLVNAYEISHEGRYLERASQVWAFIEQYFADREVGEWHARLTRDRHPILNNKADAWKCPYHNTRACLEVIARLG